MSVSISVPDELYRKAAAIAEEQRVPVEEVFSSAFQHQLGHWERLKQRAKRGNREKFLAALDKAPAVEPEESDRT